MATKSKIIQFTNKKIVKQASYRVFVHCLAVI